MPQHPPARIGCTCSHQLVNGANNHGNVGKSPRRSAPSSSSLSRRTNQPAGTSHVWLACRHTASASSSARNHGVSAALQRGQQKRDFTNPVLPQRPRHGNISDSRGALMMRRRRPRPDAPPAQRSDEPQSKRTKQACFVGSIRELGSFSALGIRVSPVVYACSCGRSLVRIVDDVSHPRQPHGLHVSCDRAESLTPSLNKIDVALLFVRTFRGNQIGKNSLQHARDFGQHRAHAQLRRTQCFNVTSYISKSGIEHLLRLRNSLHLFSAISRKSIGTQLICLRKAAKAQQMLKRSPNIGECCPNPTSETEPDMSRRPIAVTTTPPSITTPALTTTPPAVAAPPTTSPPRRAASPHLTRRLLDGIRRRSPGRPSSGCVPLDGVQHHPPVGVVQLVPGPLERQ
jgi:hypothetical protein